MGTVTRRKKGEGSLRELKPGLWQYRFAGVAYHPTELGVSGFIQCNTRIRAATRALAARVAEAQRAAKLQATLHPEDDPVTTWQFYQQYETAVLRGKNHPNYRSNITQGIRRFCDWMQQHHPNTPILRITRKHAMAYMGWAMTAYRWRKATVKRNCTYLSQLWEVLIDEDRIEEQGNLWRELPKRIYRRADLATTKDNDSRPKYILTWTEADAVLATLPPTTRFLCDFLRQVPLRRTAFINATLTDLRHDAERDLWLLDVPTSKNKQARSIPLPKALHTALLAWRLRVVLAAIGPKAPLFGHWSTSRGWQTLYRAWQRAQTDAGVIHPMNLHNLRDMFSHAKLQSGVADATVAYLMGNDPRTMRAHYGYHVVADDAQRAMGC